MANPSDTAKTFLNAQISGFSDFASGNAKGVRVVFPKTQSRIFFALYAVVQTFCDRGQNVHSLNLLLAFVASVRTTVDTLKGREGILAVCTFLNVLLTLLDTLWTQQEFVGALTMPNMELNAKLDSLEAKINKMREVESLGSAGGGGGSGAIDHLLIDGQAPTEAPQSKGKHANIPEPSVAVGDVAAGVAADVYVLISQGLSPLSRLNVLSLNESTQSVSTIDSSLLEWLAGAIPLIGWHGIQILRTYMGRPRDNLSTESTLVCCTRILA
jgi:hypothetical protein